MYQINHNQDLDYLEIKNSNLNAYAKIYLNDGASLQELTLNGHELIKDLSPLPYSDTYASSVLFPFANRIKDGIYTFQGEKFQFEANQTQENNALHGLVYNKTFNIVEQKATANEASVKLEYIENKNAIGFPYTYSIILEYILSNNMLTLIVTIKNTSEKAFPFTLGWHPYFISDNLHKSSLHFDSNQKLIIGDRNITTGIEDINALTSFEIKDKQLDDCWILNGNSVQFVTPKYKFSINSSAKNNFLQAYTPPKANTIAIEPTTGVSDSFNNQIGLEILKPRDTYSIIWNLKII